MNRTAIDESVALVNQESEADRLAKAVADKMFANDRASRTAGIELLEVREGYARLTFVIREDMLSGHGLAHGGYIFLLADAAFAYACNSRDRSTIALQCSISFSAPGRLGSRLTATCYERFGGGRTGTYDCDVIDDRGNALAFFRGTSYGVRQTVV